MELRTLNQIRQVADVLPSQSSKSERLGRWAEALDREGNRRLNTLYQIEYVPPPLRAGVRADDSPLSVAFADAQLRAAGLVGDTVGDAVAFFGVSEKQLHDILCFCHHGKTMSAYAAAARVRAAATRAEPAQRPQIVAPVVVGGIAAALISAATLL